MGGLCRRRPGGLGPVGSCSATRSESASGVTFSASGQYSTSRRASRFARLGRSSRAACSRSAYGPRLVGLLLASSTPGLHLDFARRRRRPTRPPVATNTRRLGSRSRTAGMSLTSRLRCLAEIGHHRRPGRARSRRRAHPLGRATSSTTHLASWWQHRTAAIHLDGAPPMSARPAGVVGLEHSGRRWPSSGDATATASARAPRASARRPPDHSSTVAGRTEPSTPAVAIPAARQGRRRRLAGEAHGQRRPCASAPVDRVTLASRSPGRVRACGASACSCAPTRLLVRSSARPLASSRTRPCAVNWSSAVLAAVPATGLVGEPAARGGVA